MARIPINYGTTAGDGTGDILFTSFKNINDNFIELYNNDLENVIVCNQANKGTTLGGTIDSTKQYIIDGIIDMGTTQITVPTTGLSLKGLSFDTSKLISSSNTYTMFTSPVGGSGNILGKDYAVEVTGTNSKVYNLKSATGAEAFEFSMINYNNCTSLGVIDNYRQGFETGTGRFGGTPELELKGVWSGGYFIDSSIVRNLTDGSYSLFKAGSGLTFASRFRTNMNADLNATVSLVDFSDSNFINANTLQFNSVFVSRNGVFNAGDLTLIPNILPSSLKSQWRDNTGIGNTFIGGELNVDAEIATTITTQSVFVDLAGTFSASGLQHFDSPVSGQLRHLGNSPRAFKVEASFILDSASNNEVDLKIVAWDDSAGTFVDYKKIRRTINNLVGGRDVAYFTFSDNVMLEENDYVKLQVANVNATNNITAELDSELIIEER